MNTRVDRRKLAIELLSLSRQMLSAMEERHWENLEESQQQRESLATALFSDLEPGRMGDMGWIAVVEEVQAVNVALLAAASRARDEAGEELHAFRNARKRESVYTSLMNME